MGSHKIGRVILYAPALLCFRKYWPDDGLLRAKLIVNNRNNKRKRHLCQTEYIFNFILILYFKHNGISSAKFCSIAVFRDFVALSKILISLYK